MIFTITIDTIITKDTKIEFVYSTPPQPSQIYFTADILDNLTFQQDNTYDPNKTNHGGSELQGDISNIAYCYTSLNSIAATISLNIPQDNIPLLELDFIRAIPPGIITCNARAAHITTNQAPIYANKITISTISTPQFTLTEPFSILPIIPLPTTNPIHLHYIPPIHGQTVELLYGRVSFYFPESLTPNIIVPIEIGYRTSPNDEIIFTPPTDINEYYFSNQIQNYLNGYAREYLSNSHSPLILDCGINVRLYIPLRPRILPNGDTYIPMYLLTGSTPGTISRCIIPINQMILSKEIILKKKIVIPEPYRLNFDETLHIALHMKGLGHSFLTTEDYDFDYLRTVYASPTEISSNNYDEYIEIKQIIRGSFANGKNLFSIQDVEGENVALLFSQMSLDKSRYRQCNDDITCQWLPIVWTRFTTRYNSDFIVLNHFLEIELIFEYQKQPQGYPAITLIYDIGLLYQGTLSTQNSFIPVIDSAKMTQITSDNKLNFQFSLTQLGLNPLVPIDPDNYSFHDVAVKFSIHGQEIRHLFDEETRILTNTICKIQQYNGDGEPIDGHGGYHLSTSMVPCVPNRLSPCLAPWYDIKDLNVKTDDIYYIIKGFFQPTDTMTIFCSIPFFNNLPKISILPNLIQAVIFNRFQSSHKITRFSTSELSTLNFPSQQPSITNLVHIIVQTKHSFSNVDLPNNNAQLYTLTLSEILSHLKTSLYYIDPITQKYIPIPTNQNPFSTIVIDDFIINGDFLAEYNQLDHSRGPWTPIFRTQLTFDTYKPGPHRVYQLSKPHGIISLYIPITTFEKKGISYSLSDFSNFIIPFDPLDDKYRFDLRSYTGPNIRHCDTAQQLTQFLSKNWPFDAFPACLASIGQRCTSSSQCQQLQWLYNEDDINTHVQCYQFQCSLQPMVKNLNSTISAHVQSEIFDASGLNVPFIDSLELGNKEMIILGAPINNVGRQAMLYGQIACGFHNCNDIWFHPYFSLEVKLPCPLVNPSNGNPAVLNVTLDIYDSSYRQLLDSTLNYLLPQQTADPRLYMLPAGDALKLTSPQGSADSLFMVIRFLEMGFSSDCLVGSRIQTFFTIGYQSTVGFSPLIYPLVPAQRLVAPINKARGQLLLGPAGSDDTTFELQWDDLNGKFPLADLDQFKNFKNLSPHTPQQLIPSLPFLNKVIFTLYLGDMIAPIKPSSKLRIYPTGLTQSSSVRYHISEIKCSLYGIDLQHPKECFQDGEKVQCEPDPYNLSLFFEWSLTTLIGEFEKGTAYLECITQLSTVNYKSIISSFKVGNFGFAIQIFDNDLGCEEPDHAPLRCGRVFVASSPNNDLIVIDLDEYSTKIGHKLNTQFIYEPKVEKKNYYLRFIPTTLFDDNDQEVTIYNHPYLATYDYNDPTLIPNHPVQEPQLFSTITDLKIYITGRHIDSIYQSIGNTCSQYTIYCLSIDPENNIDLYGEYNYRYFSLQQNDLFIDEKSSTQQEATQFIVKPRSTDVLNTFSAVDKDIICQKYQIVFQHEFLSSKAVPKANIPSMSSVLVMKQSLVLDDDLKDQYEYYTYEQTAHSEQIDKKHRDFISIFPELSPILTLDRPSTFSYYTELGIDGPFTIWFGLKFDLRGQTMTYPNVKNNQIELVLFDPDWHFGILKEEKKRHHVGEFQLGGDDGDDGDDDHHTGTKIENNTIDILISNINYDRLYSLDYSQEELLIIFDYGQDSHQQMKRQILKQTQNTNDQNDDQILIVTAQDHFNSLNSQSDNTISDTSSILPQSNRTLNSKTTPFTTAQSDPPKSFAYDPQTNYPYTTACLLKRDGTIFAVLQGKITHPNRFILRQADPNKDTFDITSSSGEISISCVGLHLKPTPLAKLSEERWKISFPPSIAMSSNNYQYISSVYLWDPRFLRPNNDNNGGMPIIITILFVILITSVVLFILGVIILLLLWHFDILESIAPETANYVTRTYYNVDVDEIYGTRQAALRTAQAESNTPSQNGGNNSPTTGPVESTRRGSLGGIGKARDRRLEKSPSLLSIDESIQRMRSFSTSEMVTIVGSKDSDDDGNDGNDGLKMAVRNQQHSSRVPVIHRVDIKNNNNHQPYGQYNTNTKTLSTVNETENDGFNDALLKKNHFENSEDDNFDSKNQTNSNKSENQNNSQKFQLIPSKITSAGSINGDGIIYDQDNVHEYIGIDDDNDVELP
jgi:hypothetical protein